MFDAHFHIIDDSFPLISNNGYIPEPFRCDDYKMFTEKMLLDHQCEFVGGAIVSGSFQGYDQSYLCDALNKLGGQYVGVLQLDPNEVISDEVIYDLHVQGVRAVRFNFLRSVVVGSSDDLRDENTYSTLLAFAERIYKLVGWHSEFYIKSSSLESTSSQLFQLLATAPKVVIDHMGIDVVDNEDGEKGFALLLELLRIGRNISVKASGFGRLGTTNDVLINRLKAVTELSAESILFGSDVPGTRAPLTFDHSHIRLIEDNFNEEICKKILHKNGQSLYHISGKPFQVLDCHPVYLLI